MVWRPPVLSAGKFLEFWGSIVDRSFLPRFVNCREFVNADLIAAGLSPFDPDSQAVATGRLMLLRIDELVCARQSFGFETTLAGRIHARRRTSNSTGDRETPFFGWESGISAHSIATLPMTGTS